jgi:MFS-type transporter involved in bile tolerance (Atg22 family)
VFNQETIMSTLATTSKSSTGAIWRGGLIAAVVSAVVNAILFLIGAALGGFPESVISPLGYPITIGVVVIMSIIPVLLGTVAYWLLRRYTNRANLWFGLIVAVVFIGMFSGPLQLPGAPLLMIVLLEIMHVVTAGAAVYFLTRS